MRRYCPHWTWTGSLSCGHQATDRRWQGLLTSSLSLIRASGDVLVVTSWTFGLNNVQLVKGRGGGQVRDLKEIAHQQNDGGHSE